MIHCSIKIQPFALSLGDRIIIRESVDGSWTALRRLFRERYSKNILKNEVIFSLYEPDSVDEEVLSYRSKIITYLVYVLEKHTFEGY